MDLLNLLTELSETHGPSGYEDRIAKVVSEKWEHLADSVVSDRIGNVIAAKTGAGAEPRLQLLLAAHLDEIGLMVTGLLEQYGHGYLRVTDIGGVDLRQLYSQNVVVHGRRDVPGVLASLPARMLPEIKRNQPYDFEDLVVDPGLPIADLKKLVEVGDFITFDQPLRKLMGSVVTGKSFDNRASVAAITLCLEQLSRRAHEWDVIAVATAQEETRLLGAYTSAFAQMPDAAIAVDTTFAKGAGYTDSSALELDSGPALEIGPNIHPGIYKSLKNAADRIEMDVTVLTHTRTSGTDAFGIQVARSGIPTGLISIPTRYLHTMVETLNINDIERTARLLVEFIAGLDSNFINELEREMLGDS